MVEETPWISEKLQAHMNPKGGTTPQRADKISEVASTAIMFQVRESHSPTGHKVDSGTSVTSEMTRVHSIFWSTRKTSSSSLISV